MSFQVGDAIALTRLAVKLYTDGILVARAAPETFKDLLEELYLVKTILYRIDQRYIDYGREYDESATLALRRCKKALLLFQPLVKKYEKLGSTHRGSRLRQMQYPIDRGKIVACRDELARTTHYLNLILSAESALGPLDPLPAARVTSIRTQHTEDADSNAPELSPVGLRDGPRLLETSKQRPLPFLSRVNRIETLETHAESDDSLLTPVARANAESIKDPHSEAASSLHSADRSSRTSFTGSSALGPSVESSAKRHSEGPMATVTVVKPWYPPVPTYRASERAIEIDPVDHQQIMEALDENEAFVTLNDKFSESAKLLGDDIGIEDLLVRAVWWFLKSQVIISVLSSASQPARISRRAESWPVRISREQAAADLWKSCWILKYLVLAEHNEEKWVSDATWTALQVLAQSIREELQLPTSDTLTEVLKPTTNINKQAFAFAEKQFQSLEALSDLPAGLDNIEPPARFMTVHDDDAGTANEKVLFRTFVDAKIGHHDARQQSSGAPYMLLLWSQHGRSEILVNLINQAGTINLCTPLTNEDLQRHREHTHSELQFDLNFASQNAVVQFISPAELQRFLEIPSKLFSALSNRDAKQDEFLLFREGLLAFDHRTPQAQAQASPHQDDLNTKAHSSCEISLYGAVPDQCFKTVRRLVVSSALDATNPWCHAYWLPIDNIQVQGDSRHVELSWSDCGNLINKGDGEYGKLYSYVWSPKQPNHTVHVQFETSEIADEFRASILRPWVTPFDFDNHLKLEASFQSAVSEETSSTPFVRDRELSIWRLRDLNVTQNETYISIVSTERLPAASGFITYVYFLGEGLDVAIEDPDLHSLHFPALWGAHYLSNVVESRKYPTSPATCVDVDWAEREATLYFADAEQMVLFAKTIVDWELKFSVHALSMSISTGLGLHSTRKPVLLSLWENPNPVSPHDIQLRLALRWTGTLTRTDDHRWVTADITQIADCIAKPDARKLTFRKVEVRQGEELSIQTLNAMDSKGEAPRKTVRELVVILPEAEAVEQLKARIYDLLCGPGPVTRVAYRPGMARTGRTHSDAGGDSGISSSSRWVPRRGTRGSEAGPRPSIGSLTLSRSATKESTGSSKTEMKDPLRLSRLETREPATSARTDTMDSRREMQQLRRA